MPFLDFGELKARTSFEQLVTRLELPLKRTGNQWRGPCPQCKTGGDRALVITEDKGFFCFGAKRGGDQIALVAHILDCPVRQAAEWIAGRSERTGTSKPVQRTSQTVPESEEGTSSKLQPLPYLEADHQAIAALGLDPQFCQAHGIGYAPRGVVRGSIAIPFRDETGKLLGYFGVQDLTYVPPDFTTNVVELKRA